MSSKGIAQTNRPTNTAFDAPTAARLRKFIAEHGKKRSAALLGTGVYTLEAAAHEGLVRSDTADRLRTRLAEYEP